MILGQQQQMMIQSRIDMVRTKYRYVIWTNWRREGESSGVKT